MNFVQYQSDMRNNYIQNILTKLTLNYSRSLSLYSTYEVGVDKILSLSLSRIHVLGVDEY